MSNLPYVLEGRYTRGHPLDMEDARGAARAFGEMRRSARAMLETAVEAHAEAEREYRRGRARAYVTVEAKTAGERDSKVDDMAADLRYVRDVKKGLVDAAKEKLAEVDGERASFHRLLEWSMRLDAFAQENREPRGGT